MDEELEELYNDLIMEHGMNSYNKKELDNPNFSELGHNPSCGDEIKLEMKLDGNKIEDMAFTGHGCAISQASTSIMIDVLKGKTIEEAKEIISIFIKMIDREKVSDEELEKLEEGLAFKNIQNMPARVKCALLAWKTMDEIIDKNKLSGEGKIESCH
jgi:nitrogen fixation NifU-like protein